MPGLRCARCLSDTGANIHPWERYTLGAAMAGLPLGVPSSALSQFFTRRDAVTWGPARALAPDVIRTVIGMEWATAPA